MKYNYKVCLVVEHEGGLFSLQVLAANEEQAAIKAVEALEKAYPIYKGRAKVYSVRAI